MLYISRLLLNSFLVLCFNNIFFLCSVSVSTQSSLSSLYICLLLGVKRACLHFCLCEGRFPLGHPLCGLFPPWLVVSPLLLTEVLFRQGSLGPLLDSFPPSNCPSSLPCFPPFPLCPFILCPPHHSFLPILLQPSFYPEATLVATLALCLTRVSPAPPEPRSSLHSFHRVCLFLYNNNMLYNMSTHSCGGGSVAPSVMALFLIISHGPSLVMCFSWAGS